MTDTPTRPRRHGQGKGQKMTKAQMAEYTVNGIGGNGNQGPEPGHGTFIGHVDSDGPSKFTANAGARKPLNLDMDEVAQARTEAEAMWN